MISQEKCTRPTDSVNNSSKFRCWLFLQPTRSECIRILILPCLKYVGIVWSKTPAWARGTEYRVNFVLLNKIVCFVLCVTLFPFVIFSADLKVFSYIVSHYLYVMILVKIVWFSSLPRPVTTNNHLRSNNYNSIPACVINFNSTQIRKMRHKMYEKTFKSAKKITNGNDVTHNTKHTILINKTKFTPYSVPPAHAPTTVLYPHFVVTFNFFWLLLVYLNLVSLSDMRNKITCMLPP